jgi:hypothetical protein
VGVAVVATECRKGAARSIVVGGAGTGAAGTVAVAALVVKTVALAELEAVVVADVGVDVMSRIENGPGVIDEGVVVVVVSVRGVDVGCVDAGTRAGVGAAAMAGLMWALRRKPGCGCGENCAVAEVVAVAACWGWCCCGWGAGAEAGVALCCGCGCGCFGTVETGSELALLLLLGPWRLMLRLGFVLLLLLQRENRGGRLASGVRGGCVLRKDGQGHEGGLMAIIIRPVRIAGSGGTSVRKRRRTSVGGRRG